MKSNRVSGSVRLTAEFIKLAAEFGMIPAELAERVLEKFAKERPKKITIGRKRKEAA